MPGKCPTPTINSSGFEDGGLEEFGVNAGNWMWQPHGMRPSGGDINGKHLC